MSETVQMLLNGVAFNELEYSEVITARDLQREKVQEVEQKLLESIYNLTSEFSFILLLQRQSLCFLRKASRSTIVMESISFQR